MNFIINWELNEHEFSEQLFKLTKQCQDTGSIIPLPIPQPTGDIFLILSSFILSQVSCHGCDARCCKSNPPTEDPTFFTSKEYRRIMDLHPEYGVISRKFRAVREIGYECDMPCPLLLNNRCGAYEVRPFVCFFYPIQFGGSANSVAVMSLSSYCPESARIAIKIYELTWESRKRMTEVRSIFS